jgi:hypothetical protein
LSNNNLKIAIFWDVIRYITVDMYSIVTFQKIGIIIIITSL